MKQDCDLDSDLSHKHIGNENHFLYVSYSKLYETNISPKTSPNFQRFINFDHY